MVEKKMKDKLQIAIAEIGNKEIPLKSNWGVHVQKYLASVDIFFAAPWCMAFVYWCCKEADANTPLIKTGSVLKQWNAIEPKYKFTEPEPGDIGIMDFGGGLGHTFFVEAVQIIIGVKYIHTIEGNATTVNGSREGIEVCRKLRTAKSCKGFIRI